MNNIRRKELNAIYLLLDEAKSRLEFVKDEEEEYRDNIPENLQTSERYERADEVVTLLDDSLDSLDEILDNILESV